MPGTNIALETITNMWKLLCYELPYVFAPFQQRLQNGPFSYGARHPFFAHDTTCRYCKKPFIDQLEKNTNFKTTSKWSNLSRHVNGILVQYTARSSFCKLANSSPLRRQQVWQLETFFKCALQLSHFGTILMTKKLITKWKHSRKRRYSRIFGIHNIKNCIFTSKHFQIGQITFNNQRKQSENNSFEDSWI